MLKSTCKPRLWMNGLIFQRKSKKNFPGDAGRALRTAQALACLVLLPGQAKHGMGVPASLGLLLEKTIPYKGSDVAAILSGHTDTRCYILPIVNPMFCAEDRKGTPAAGPGKFS